MKKVVLGTVAAVISLLSGVYFTEDLDEISLGLQGQVIVNQTQSESLIEENKPSLKSTEELNNRKLISVDKKLSKKQNLPLPQEKSDYKYGFTWKGKFKGAELIHSREKYLETTNELRRESLIKVEDMKYPFLRVEEVFDTLTSPENAKPKYYVESVADHLIVNVGNYDEIKELMDFVSGSSIRKLSGNKYIIAFEDFDLDTVSQAISSLNSNQNIRYAEPDYLVHTSLTPDDSDYSELWGLHNSGQSGGTIDADIDAPEAWNVSTGSSEIIVAVIDTGVDYTHDDLAVNMWKNPGEIGIDSNGNDKHTNGIDDDGNGYIDDVYGYDFINDDSDPIDNDHYHGTHCAGTIGGVGNNGSGVVGVSWQVKMMAIKFLGPFGGYTSDAVQSVEYATAMGAHLTSNSWGGGGYSQALKDAIDAAGANDTLFIAAAGNNGRDTDTSTHYPSSYLSGNIISVAATDHNDDIASFSNYGLQSVDIGAPGVSIYSTSPDNSYRTLSGTSMATPHVSGVVALLLKEFPGETINEIKNRLYESGDANAALTGKTVTGKRLNAYKALTYNENRAILTSPQLGSEFEASSVTFNWSSGSGVTSYRLIVGSTLGGSDLYDSGSTSQRTAAVTGLPIDGSIVYIRLYSTISGDDQYLEYSFKSFTHEDYRPAASEMISPEDNSTLDGASITLTWSDGRQVNNNWLYVGTYAGGRNIYTSQANSGVTLDMPVDGRTVYIRLWSELPDGWVYNDYVYTSHYDENNLPEKSTMVSPVNGSDLNSGDITFTCTEGNSVEYKYIYFGSTQGNYDLGHSPVSDNSVTHSLVPDGIKVYVRLWSRIYGTWEYSDYEYSFSDYLSRVALQERYRLYNPDSGHHFWTTNSGEYNILIDQHNWNGEGIGHKALLADSSEGSPYYRLFNPNTYQHHWTTSHGEYSLLIEYGWNDEGYKSKVYEADNSSTVGLFRVYNPNTGLHHYTTSEAEYNALVSYGWIGEGISAYVFPL